MKYDIFGLGNPLIDVITAVSEETMVELKLTKGSMNLVDQERQQEILKACEGKESTEALGGSCGNSIVMIGQLGGKTAFTGCAGEDNFALIYEEELTANGVDSYLAAEEGVTGTSVILVTPDGERTMNTHLGRCQDLHSEQLNLEAIADSSYLYIEGYLWDTPSQQEAVMTAVKHAKAKGVKISLSLSDPFCVNRNREAFQLLLDDYVDLVFCNEDEGRQMTGEEDSDAVLQKLGASCNEVALTLGSKGAKIKRGEEVYSIPSFPVTAVDTTGAGDSFAAGYLYGITQGFHPEVAGKIGSKAASIVVSQMGPRYEGNLRKALEEVLP